jgi:hypothetical protein
MHEENSNGEGEVVIKREGKELLELRHQKNRANPVIDQTNHELKLVDFDEKPKNHGEFY